MPLVVDGTVTPSTLGGRAKLLLLLPVVRHVEPVGAERNDGKRRQASRGDMPEKQDTEQRTQHGQVTLGHLLLSIAFFIPVETVIFEIKHVGGRPVQYALGVPLGLGLGAVIGRLSWISGRSLWLRSQRYSQKVQNGIAIGVFALDIVWIIVGGIAGTALAHLLIHSSH